MLSRSRSNTHLPTHRAILRTIFYTAGLLLLATHLAWAQPPSLSDQQERLQRERQEQEERLRRDRQEAEARKQREQRKDVFLQEKTSQEQDTSLPEEPLMFPIRTIRLEGERVEQFPWVKDFLAPYHNRAIGRQGIQTIVKRLNNAFIDQGYITSRVVIPEQDLSTGTLRLTLIPGTIHAIRFAGPAYAGNWYTAFPTGPGQVLNLRDIEQGLEQMKRVPSQEVDMQLVPGEQPGESDIVLTTKETKPWKAVYSLDDSGSSATGKLQSSFTFSYHNPLRLNDLFHIALNHDAENDGDRGTKGNSLYYSFPYGNSTFTLTASENRYHQTVAGTTETFVSSGDSENLEFKLSQLLGRDQTSKTHLELRTVRSLSKSYIDDTEILVQRKKTTAFEWALSRSETCGALSIDIQVANKRGVPWFGAQAEPDSPAPETPTTRYSLWTFHSQITTPLMIHNLSTRYSLTIRGQTTSDYLYGSEHFSIGNRYTVRGFDGEQTLAAECGWYIQNELSIPLQAGLELYLGLDYGEVHGPASQYLLGKTLAGSVLGIRGAAWGAQYDLFAGWPLIKPQGFETAHTTCGFQLVYQL